MKRGTKIAIERGMKMMQYLEDNSDRRMAPDLHLDAGRVTVNGYFKSHRSVMKFKREFGLKRFNKRTITGTMYYETEERFVKATLDVSLAIEGKLPPRCSLVEKEVWVDERVVEGHYEKRTEIVCDKPVEQETAKAE